MIPFLKKDVRQSGVITSVRSPDGGKTERPADMSGLEIAMEDYCRAEERKDYKAMAAAFRAAFDILESEPHDEYDHEEEQE